MSVHESGSAWFTRFCKLTAGTKLYRNHFAKIDGKEIRGSDFNPCKGKPSRFSPLYTPEKRCVSTLYAASSFKAAAVETVFRSGGVTSNAIPPTVRWDRINTRRATILRPLRDLTLISFHNANLKENGVNAKNVTGPNADYGVSRKFAQRAMMENIGVDGIAWKSERFGNAGEQEWCYIIFCHHHHQHGNEILFETETVEEKMFFENMVKLAEETGYVINLHGS